MASVRIDGTTFYYREHGVGPPLLLIHGNGGGTDVWGDTVGELAACFRVVAYDRRGFGRSAHAPVRDWHRHGRDAAGLLRVLGAAPATVVGWSGGGITALDLAVSHPELVSALVLAEPPLHAKRHLTARMAATMLGAQVLRRTRGERAAAEHFYRWATRYTSGGCAFDRFPPQLRAAMRSTAAATLAELDAGTGEHLTAAAVGSIRCPVTCLVGDLSDPVFPAATRRISHMLPHAAVVTITRAGHALHFDQPEQFATAVRSAGADPGARTAPVTTHHTTKENRDDNHSGDGTDVDRRDRMLPCPGTGQPTQRDLRDHPAGGGAVMTTLHPAGDVAQQVTSLDGTSIGYWRTGTGSPLVLVHGTTADHTRWRTVLPLLAPHATVCAVDRRGRGASGDAPGYAIATEYADIAAVVEALADVAGAPVDLLGHSYGAICSLEATLRTPAVRRLVLYEPPILAPARSDTDDRLAELLAQDRRAEIIETFFREIVGMPEAELELLRSLPSWSARVAAAHTVVRERLVDPPYLFEPARFSGLGVPTLLLAGGESPGFLRASTDALAAAIPGARVVTLEGQQHVAMDTAPVRFVAEVLGFLRGGPS